MVLASIDAVRNGRALYLLLATTALSGLLLWATRRALVAQADAWAVLSAGATFFVTFYGSNATGIVLMDEACGRAPRHPRDAIADALARGHRLLVVVLCVLLVMLALLAVVGGLLWVARLPALGSSLLSLVVPAGVLVLGLAALLIVGVIGPLAAPAVWAGLPVAAVLRLLTAELRGRAPQLLLLTAAVSLLSAAVAGLVSFALLAGGRALLALAAVLVGLDLAPQALLGALFGRGAPPGLSPHAAAAVTGGGVAFAFGLVLPGVVYLRGLCAVFLAVHPDPDAAASDLPPTS
ncbi:hypothetical protein HLB44_19965 [Aquincola sp. S2]|uniref:Uncharacterized protein n=1 Tax=Pseudaquabacterium terrae TaxID=2732868 RepID=A0ABX2EKY8_9BURK|nr:hypothetical protein [Aquabacterium terrae]NRF69278.1 hypothetical protein [Aquabacterium terrae]